GIKPSRSIRANPHLGLVSLNCIPIAIRTFISIQIFTIVEAYFEVASRRV
ncbi:hypothetical protein AOQ84DRAFT_392960, partial [Glonium stellatum]